MSGSLVPSVDFTPLSRLGETLARGVRENERRNALQGLGVSPGDPNFLPKLGQTLVGLGDIDGALTVSRLQEASQDRAYQRTTDARDFAFRKQAFDVGREDAAYNRSRQDRLDTRSADQEKLRNYYLDQGDKRAQESLDLQRQAATRKAVPEGFEVDPNNPGGFRPIANGPADPRYIEQRKAAENSSKAEKPQLPGGELAARIGLGNQFLDNDLPEIRKQIDAGVLGGGMNPLTNAQAAAQMYSGTGAPGGVSRRISTGVDALMRNLTGAGMSESEAKAYAERYRPQWNDSLDTIKGKVTGLENDLKATRDAALAGRNITDPALTGRGSASPSSSSPAPASQANPRMVPLDQVKEGQRFRRDGRTYRRVNGQDVPE